MYKKVFHEWVTSSTSHGIPNIFKANNKIIKFMWSIVIIGSLSYCFFTIVESIATYRKYETSINTQQLREVPSVFPAVTICNLNPFDFDSNRQYFSNLFKKNNLSFAEYLNDVTVELPRINSDQMKTLKEFSSIIKRLVALDSSLNDTTRRMLGFSLQNTMLLNCNYNKHTCSASDFYQVWHDNYGNCYTFNSGKDAEGVKKPIKLTSRTGPDYGLSLELLIGSPYLNNQYSTMQGLYIIIHDNDQYPFLIDDGITISTGFSTFLPIKRIKFQKLSEPYSNCLKELKPFSNYSRKLYGFMRQMEISDYNSEFCYKFCYQDKLIDKCNCSDINVVKIRNVSFCNSREELKCLSEMNDIFSSSNIELLCDYACPIECSTSKFRALDHKATFPSEFYYAQLMLQATTDWSANKNTPYWSISCAYELFERQRINALQRLRDNIVRIVVNYDDLRYTYIQETPIMTFDTLLGVLGGQLGLFIGISFLSFVELFELIIQFISIYMKSRKYKLKSESKNDISVVGI